MNQTIMWQLHDKFEVPDVEIQNSKSVRSEMRLAINLLLKVIISHHSAPYFPQVLIL